MLAGQAIAEQRLGQLHFPHTKIRHPAGVVEKCREAFDSAIVPWSGVLKQYRGGWPASARHHIPTRSSGFRYSLSPGAIS